MRNKLSFDLQLSARKAAIAERIAAHKIARSKVSVFLMAMSAGVFMAIGFTFYLSVIADAPSSQALTDAPRDKCTLSCAINGIHAAFHYLKKNYISGCVMTVPTGW